MITTYMREAVPETDPKDWPITRPMSAFVNRVLNECQVSRYGRRTAVGVRVLDEVPGTVARWVPDHNEIDLARTILQAADPSLLCTEEDIRRNPEMYGPIIHEILHVLFSHLDLKKAVKEITPRELNALKLLEEGRIEVQGKERLSALHLDALRAGLVSYVFVDLLALEEESKDFLDKIDEEAQRVYQSVQVMAMMYLRYTHNVMDSSLESVKTVIDKLQDIIGADYYPKFAELADRYASIRFDYWSQDVDTAYDIAREWVKLEDELLKQHGYEPEPEPGEGGEGGEPGGEPGEGKGEGDSDGDGDGEPDDGDGKSGRNGGQSDEAGDGQRDGTKYSGNRDGEPGDGEKESHADSFGGGGLGTYGSSRKVSGDKPVDLMRGLLNDADKEIRRISGQRLKAGITATIKKVDDYEHIRAEHKRKAREAWKQLGNK